jgi:hypothetical protein
MGAASTLLCAFSAQFMYAAHFGRQEVFILLFMLLSYMLVEKGVYYNPRSHAGKYAFGAALITACAIGFHPNSFLIACITGCVLIADSIVHKRIQPLMTYVLTTGTAAALYIFISLSWNAGFIADYNAFGDTLGATLTPMEKLKAFPLFLFKLYHQISATYFTPDIRADLIMGLLVFILAGALIFTTIIKKSKRKTHVDTALIALPMFSTLGLTAGLIIIGRYNATSIVFYLLFLALCTHGILFNQYKKHCLKATPLYTRSLLSATVILILIVGLNGFRQVVSKPIENYTDYTSKIHHAVTLDSNDRALCNLNAGFAFKPDQFVDYRDLGMLKAKNISIDSYLDSNHIEYIILSEEMDYIYRNQDPWTILYGDMSYYPRLVELIERDYRLVEAFNSPLYGMRITRYNDGYPWRVAVYKLNN